MITTFNISFNDLNNKGFKMTDEGTMEEYLGILLFVNYQFVSQLHPVVPFKVNIQRYLFVIHHLYHRVSGCY